MEKDIKKEDIKKITRVEVINHATNRYPIGRVITVYKDKQFKDFDLEIQDEGRTLKIFLS